LKFEIETFFFSNSYYRNALPLRHARRRGEPIKKIALNMGVEDINLFSGEEISDPSIYTVFLNGIIFNILFPFNHTFIS